MSFSLLQPTCLLQIWVEGGCDSGLKGHDPFMSVKNLIISCYVMDPM